MSAHRMQSYRQAMSIFRGIRVICLACHGHWFHPAQGVDGARPLRRAPFPLWLVGEHAPGVARGAASGHCELGEGETPSLRRRHRVLTLPGRTAGRAVRCSALGSLAAPGDLKLWNVARPRGQARSVHVPPRDTVTLRQPRPPSARAGSLAPTGSRGIRAAHWWRRARSGFPVRSRSAVCRSRGIRHELARDLINTPANDLGPAELAQAALRTLAGRHRAYAKIVSERSFDAGFPPHIHAVESGSPRSPRLIDLRWGKEGDDRITLVGKGVCFDKAAGSISSREAACCS